MCYYDQVHWACGYWRWSTFREQCTREYRTGETCGLRLALGITHVNESCKVCKDMEKKQRKLAKLQSDVYRWQGEGNRNASIEKAEREMAEIESVLAGLGLEHWERVNRQV